MRLLSVLLILCLLACSSSNDAGTDSADSSETVIYFSRHAEKADGDDPALLPAGTARAKRLADRLADQQIVAVYSTDFRRTQSTAQPMADRIGKSVKSYSASTNARQQTLKWLRKYRGKRILVVGHSNTIPDLLNALVGEARYGNIDEEEFSKLWRVSVAGNGTVAVTELSTD